MSLLWSMFWIILPIAAIVLLSNRDKQTTKRQSKHVEKAEKKDNTAILNILLVVGSFLIIFAVLQAISSLPQLIPPVIIAITLLFFGAGLFLDQKYSYFRPVARTFTYTAIIMFAFWGTTLGNVGVSSRMATFISFIAPTIAMWITVIVRKDVVVSYFAYVWTILTCIDALSLLLISGYVLTSKTMPYILLLTPAVISFIPQLWWIKRVTWLPVAMRRATMDMGKIIMPVVAAISVFTLFIPTLGEHYPLLRTLVALCCLTHYALFWFSEKKPYQMLCLRFAAQITVVALVMDILAMVSKSSQANLSDTMVLVSAIVWQVTFLGQAIYSIFAKHSDQEFAKVERIAGTVSLTGVFLTPLLCIGLGEMSLVIIRLMTYAALAILGVVYAIRHRNANWMLATVFVLLLTPIQFVRLQDLGVIKWWTEWSSLISYAIVAFLYVIGYVVFRKIDEKRALTVGLIGIALASLPLLALGLKLEYASLAWMIIASSLLALGLVSRKKFVYETALYAGALCVYSILGEVFRAVSHGSARGLNGYDDETLVPLSVLRIHVLGLALLAASFWREHGLSMDRRVRFLASYAILTIGMYTVSVYSHFGITDNGGYILLFLFEQLVLLVVGAKCRCKWLTVCSAIGTFLAAIHLTGGMSYFWFAMAGVGLIAIVAYMLAKQNKQSQNPNPEKPKLN